jgi:NADPH-dependent curcumin reductase CurA
MHTNLQIRFIKPVTGPVTAEHFAIENAPVPAARDGEFVVRNVFLSLDPYQRRQMMPGVHYAQLLRVGDVMVGRTIGRVVESRHADYAAGDWVRCSLGWQLFSLSDGNFVEKIELDGFAPSLYLGILGSPGITAWVGLRHVANIRAGETVVISAATGAVGSVAVRLAKLTGCRVVGIAGGPRKCAFAVESLGCDACVDYKVEDFPGLLARATPAGVDVDFENVGGPVFDSVIARLNESARIALCGLVSQYNLREPYGMRNIAELLNRNVTLQGFRVGNYANCREAALAELKERLRKCEMAVQETITDGLANAPSAFAALFAGSHLGKALIRIGD